MSNPVDISRRDYFAGAVLQGLVARSDPSDDDLSSLAMQAYWLADDMADAAVASFIDYIKKGDLRRVSALLADNKALASMIFDFGENDLLKEYNGHTALTLSITNRFPRRLEMIRLLMSHGANPKAKSKDGTALAIAEEIHDRQIMMILEGQSESSE